MSDLDLTTEIYTTSGWLDLDDESQGYSSERDSLASRTQTFRQRVVEGDWVEGSYVVSSVRANVVEALNVYIEAPSAVELGERLEVLTDALEQLRFRIRITLDGAYREWWTCMPAQYTVESPQHLRIARTCLVKAEVPRLPTLIREVVTP